MPYGFTTTELNAAGGVLLLLAGAALLAYRFYKSDADPSTAGRETGASLASPVLRAVGYLVRFVTGLGAGVVMSVSRFLPKSESMWRGVAKRGFRGMYKTAGGNPDAVAIVDREDGIDLTPVKWKRGDPDDPAESPRWVSKGSEEWHPGNEGRETELLGTVPIILLDEDAETVGSFLQSRFQAALDLGQKDKLFVPERVEQINIIGTPDEIKDFANGDAVADGGTVMQTSYEIPEADWPDKLADVLVDLSAPNGEAGMRVSAKQYKEVFQEKVGSEEMKMQEVRGRIAEADPGRAKETAMLVLKAVLAGVILARSPELLGILMGTGVGDAVGDAVPSFTILPPVWQLLTGVPF